MESSVASPTEPTESSGAFPGFDIHTLPFLSKLLSQGLHNRFSAYYASAQGVGDKNAAQDEEN